MAREVFDKEEEKPQETTNLKSEQQQKTNEDSKMSKKQSFDKDIELQKIQTLDSYFQAQYTFLSSIVVAGFIGFLVVALELFYAKTFDFLGLVTISLILLVTVSVIGYWLVGKYNYYLVFDEELLTKIKKEEPLDSLIELRKELWKKRSNQPQR